MERNNVTAKELGLVCRRQHPNPSLRPREERIWERGVPSETEGALHEHALGQARNCLPTD